jgi:hypothetical protein
MSNSKKKSITVQRKVRIMSEVTERLKARYRAELEADRGLMESELAQVTAEIGESVERNDKVIKKHQMEMTLKKIDKQLEEVSALLVGSHIQQDELLSNTVLSVGDNLREKMRGMVVLVKDDVVQDMYLETGIKRKVN